MGRSSKIMAGLLTAFGLWAIAAAVIVAANIAAYG